MSRGLKYWILDIIILLGIMGSLLMYTLPAKAATDIIIAASDSSSTWKSQATVVCSGTADQSIINSYLTSGNTVTLAPGNFYINSYILPQSNTHLLGQGNSTVIHLSNTMIIVNYNNANNVEVGNFSMVGSSPQAGILIYTSTTGSNYYVHDIQSSITGAHDFEVDPYNGGSLSNIVFARDSAIDPDGMGFILMAGAGTGTVTDVTFYKCSVTNAGVASTRLNPWVTGFDFDENQINVNRIQVIQCQVNGAWESDFHFEVAPTHTNLVIVGSTASNAGLKPSPDYGAGILASGDLVLSNNSGSNNALGDIRAWNGTSFVTYPFQDMVLGSNKVATRVNQGNCLGVIITNDIYKELVLYSADGNPVNQSIYLGGYYTSNDGNTYTFNGTQIVVQFTDYAVIQLVQTSTSSTPTSTPPSVITSAASGITTGGATFNGNLTSTGSAGSDTLSFEYGLSTSYGNSVSGSPSTLSAPGSFTSSVTGLTPGTTYHYRAKATAADGEIAYGSDQTFTTQSTTTPPSVVTDAASSITANSATLNGNISSPGTASSVAVSFQWGTTTSYGNTTAPKSLSAAGNFNVSLSGLSPNTTYHYRAMATGDGTAYGADQIFTTSPSSPSTTTFGYNSGQGTYTESANRIDLTRVQNTAGTGILTGIEIQFNQTGAQGNIRLGVYSDNAGSVGNLLLDAGEVPAGTSWVGIYGLNLPVTANSYYWLAFSLSSSNTLEWTGGGTHAADVSAPYGPLLESPTITMTNTTPYVMRAIVDVGATATPPSVITNAANNITTSGASFNGDLTSTGSTGSDTVSFQYGLTTSYGNSVPGTPSTLSAPGSFASSVTGLTSNTTYHYRAKATSGNGEIAYGSDQTFTTQSTTTPPSVVTDAASNIKPTQAQLDGSLISLGSDSNVNVYFEYGLSTNYGNTVIGTPSAMSASGDFTTCIKHLSRYTTYHYRAMVVSNGIAYYGTDQTFTTR